jgi:hypothetical protein
MEVSNINENEQLLYDLNYFALDTTTSQRMSASFLWKISPLSPRLTSRLSKKKTRRKQAEADPVQF